MQNCKVKLIDKNTATEVSRAIKSNAHNHIDDTEDDLSDCLLFAAYSEKECIGVLALQLLYPTNANIHKIEIADKEQRKNAAEEILLMTAENYCYKNGYSSLTITTVNREAYEKRGFNPLFEVHTHNQGCPTVCMRKNIRLNNFTFFDMTHPLNASTPNWDGHCGFIHKIKTDYGDCKTETKFSVHSIKMHAGIGTHMDAPAHCIASAIDISDIPISSLISPFRIIDVSDKAHERNQVSTLDIEVHENKYGPILKDTYVIFYTGWEQYWDHPEKHRNNLIFPSVSKEAAEKILTRNIVGIGIDTL